MPADQYRAPSERHRELADRTIRAGEYGESLEDVVDRVAELLADQDAGRVPIAAAGAAYQRGRGDVIRAVRAEIARTAPVEADGAFGSRLLRLLDTLEAGPRD